MMNKKQLNDYNHMELCQMYIEAFENNKQVIVRKSKELGFNGIEIFDTIEQLFDELGNIEDLNIRSFSKSKQNKNRYYLVLGNGEELEIELI